MQRTLNQLLKDAVERKPRRLSFDTTYSHDNIYDWLKTILNDWTIIIIPGASCSTFALSNWPAIGITRNSVKKSGLRKRITIKKWLEALGCYSATFIKKGPHCGVSRKTSDILPPRLIIRDRND